MSNEYTPSEFSLVHTYACYGSNGMANDRAAAERAIAKIKADAIRAAGEAMEYALSFDGTYVHNSWLQDYAVNLEEQA